MQVPFWSRLRLAPRIAIMIALTLGVNAGLETWLRGLIPPSPVLIMERDRLVDFVAQCWANAHSLNAKNPTVTLPGMMSFITTTPPDPRDFGSLFFEDLRHTIAQTLSLAIEDVTVDAQPITTISRAIAPVIVLLDEVPKKVYPIDRPVLGDTRITIRLAPDRWLVVMPATDGQEMWRQIRNFLHPMGGLLLIGCLSLVLARGITRPLSDLAQAAESLGRDRQTKLLGEYSLPEVQAIGQTFNAMQIRLKRFLDDRLQMLAAISHDLRTPLTRLRLFAEYLDDPEQRRQVLADLRDMEDMVSSTLAFASMELQNEAKVPVDLAALLISACDNAADAGFSVTYDGPDHAQLCCHPLALRRAIGNLVDNACKYATTIGVTLTDAADQMRVIISDDGPGIPPERVEQAFQPFVRLEPSRNRETGGTGLGLSITRDIIEGHGGTIALTPALPHGLVVTVTLPR